MGQREPGKGWTGGRAGTETDPRLQVSLRVRMGEEKPVEGAREFGWNNDSAVTQLLKRLEARRQKDAVLDRKMRSYQKSFM